MIRVCPSTPEDREKILDYCEGRKLHVVNERDVDNCVVIELEKDSPQGIALVTGLKTNAGAKFKTLKEAAVNLLAELIELQECKMKKAKRKKRLAEADAKIEAMSAAEILAAADHCSTCDDLTPLLKGKDVEVEEVTETDSGEPVAIVSGWYRGSKYTANVTFNGDDVISCDVEKDTGGRQHFRR